MKEELIKNGFITFDITDENELKLLSNIHSIISNNNFHTLRVSYNNVGHNHMLPYDSFSNLDIKKNELLNHPNLAQIWYVDFPKKTEIYDLLTSIYLKFYSINDIEILDSVTLFNDGCFIIPHNDGRDPKRIAGILIYLNKNYDENNGGCLILKNKTKIVPEYGRVVVIDYTENSVEHEVTKVKNSERYAICAFIHKK